MDLLADRVNYRAILRKISLTVYLAILILLFSSPGEIFFSLGTSLIHAAEIVEDINLAAKRLRLEGANLQFQGKMVEALAKYKESLALKPNQQLESLTKKLEKQIGTDGTMTMEHLSEVHQEEKVPQPSPEPALPSSTPIKQSEQSPQLAVAPAVAAEAVVPSAAPVPAHADDSFGQFRLVEQLSSSMQGGVLKGSETEVYLNLGQIHSASEGMLFEIIRQGAPIMAGNTVVAHEETPIATVELVKVREKYSIGQVKEKNGVPHDPLDAQKKKKIQRLVVGQFTFHQGLNQLTKALQEKLVTAFAVKGIQVVERDKLEQVLSEQQLGYSGLINLDSAKKIGELLGADGIVLGTVSDMGNEISLNGRMVDIGNGNTLSVGEVSLPKTPLIGQLLEARVEESGSFYMKTNETTPAPMSSGKAKPVKTELFVATISRVTSDDEKTYVTFTVSNPTKEPLYLALEDSAWNGQRSINAVLTLPGTGFSTTIPNTSVEGISFVKSPNLSEDFKYEQNYSCVYPGQSLNIALKFEPLPKDFKEGPVNVTIHFVVLGKDEKFRRISVSPTGTAARK